jgi:hypothetical protein
VIALPRVQELPRITKLDQMLMESVNNHDCLQRLCVSLNALFKGVPIPKDHGFYRKLHLDVFGHGSSSERTDQLFEMLATHGMSVGFFSLNFGENENPMAESKATSNTLRIDLSRGFENLSAELVSYLQRSHLHRKTPLQEIQVRNLCLSREMFMCPLLGEIEGEDARDYLSVTEYTFAPNTEDAYLHLNSQDVNSWKEHFSVSRLSLKQSGSHMAEALMRIARLARSLTHLNLVWKPTIGMENLTVRAHKFSGFQLASILISVAGSRLTAVESFRKCRGAVLGRRGLSCEEPFVRRGSHFSPQHRHASEEEDAKFEANHPSEGDYWIDDDGSNSN